jgi:cell volume regulation protein A
MGPSLLVLLLLGASLLLGYVGHAVARRIHASEVVLLLVAGVLAGPVLGLASPALLAPAMPVLAPIALVVVLVEGGLELPFQEARRHAPRAIAMALATWVLSAAAVATVASLLLHLAPVLAALLGMSVAATGMLVVIPLLGRLPGVAPEARVLLTVETSLGDLLSAVAVTTLASVLVLGARPWMGAVLFADKFVIGAAVGLLAGIAWARALHKLPAEAHGYPLTLGFVLIAYVAAETLQGSGYIMALAFGLFLGNAPALTRLGGLRDLSPMPSSMRAHQSELLFLLRSVYFVYLGLAVPRSILTPAFFLVGLALVSAMFVARVVAVTVAAPGAKAGTRSLLVAMMPRGLATAVIASLPAAMGVSGTQDFLAYTFLVILFCDVATSVALAVRGRSGARAEAAAAAS